MLTNESPDQVIMVNTESPIHMLNNNIRGGGVNGYSNIEDNRNLNSRRQF
jgi:hypothetical protein